MVWSGGGLAGWPCPLILECLYFSSKNMFLTVLLHHNNHGYTGAMYKKFVGLLNRIQHIKLKITPTTVVHGSLSTILEECLGAVLYTPTNVLNLLFFIRVNWGIFHSRPIRCNFLRGKKRRRNLWSQKTTIVCYFCKILYTYIYSDLMKYNVSIYYPKPSSAVWSW